MAGKQLRPRAWRFWKGSRWVVKLSTKRYNATLVYRNCSKIRRVLVVPPAYQNQDKISHLVKNDQGIGWDGAIVSGGDWVYHVVKKKVFQLDYCGGDHRFRFHEGGWSLAPAFATHDGDDVFAFHLFLMAGIRLPRTPRQTSWKRRRSTSSDYPEEKLFP